MGDGIIKALQQRGDMELVCAVESEDNPSQGQDVGEAIGFGRIGVELISSMRLDEALRHSKPDVMVDFTNAEAAVENVKSAARNGVNLVVGTTGFDAGQMREMEEAIREAGVSAVVSPNMATGVNVFFKIAQEVAGILRGYDIEIIEAHHKHKKDAPSGTALKVGELIAKETGGDLDARARYGRRGAGERKAGEIGFHSIRAGEIVGEHTVIFAGEGERLEVTHRAQGREPFITGALEAIDFIAGKKDGKIHSTWDVLSI